MRVAPVRARAAILGPLSILVAALLGLQLGDHEPGLLYLAPALLLLVALACDRYPGERLFTAVTRARPPSPTGAGSAPTLFPLAPRCFPRGGALLAFGLAGRGPPV